MLEIRLKKILTKFVHPYRLAPSEGEIAKKCQS